jgi:hypothetical protein
MGLLAYIKLFTLFPMSAKKMLLFHEERILMLPVVRVWAYWLGMRWMTEESLNMAITDGYDVAVFPGHEYQTHKYAKEQANIATNNKYLKIAHSNNVTLVPIYMAGVSRLYRYMKVRNTVLPLGLWFTLIPKLDFGIVMACGMTIKPHDLFRVYHESYNTELQEALTTATSFLNVRVDTHKPL